MWDFCQISLSSALALGVCAFPSAILCTLRGLGQHSSLLLSNSDVQSRDRTRIKLPSEYCEGICPCPLPWSRRNYPRLVHVRGMFRTSHMDFDGVFSENWWWKGLDRSSLEAASFGRLSFMCVRIATHVSRKCGTQAGASFWFVGFLSANSSDQQTS